MECGGDEVREGRMTVASGFRCMTWLATNAGYKVMCCLRCEAMFGEEDGWKVQKMAKEHERQHFPEKVRREPGDA